jgi:hypothetical protein
MDQLYSMSIKEYYGWIQYFNNRPYGWRDDHRAAIIAQTTYQGSKPLKIKELFPSLSVIGDKIENNDIKLTEGLRQLKSIAKKNKISFLEGDNASKNKLANKGVNNDD